MCVFQSDGGKFYLVFICISPITNETENFFPCFSTICISPFNIVMYVLRIMSDMIHAIYNIIIIIITFFKISLLGITPPFFSVLLSF